MGEIKKFKKIFSGPYIITEKVREKNFRVVRGHDLKPLRNMVHIDRMKPFIDRTIRPPCDEEIQEILNNDDDADEFVEEDKVQFDQPENKNGSDKICIENDTDTEGQNLDGQIQNDTILPNADGPSDITPIEINQGQDVQDDASQARTTTQVPLRRSPRT